jgi:hypothetical protein
VKQLELAAPKAAQLAAAKREEAADLEARLGQLQVGTCAPQQQLNVRVIHDPMQRKCVPPVISKQSINAIGNTHVFISNSRR